MAYERIIVNFFGDAKPKFHWMMLGMGEDGHTASIFAGSALTREKKRWVRESYSEDMNSWRVSVTFPLINIAREVVVLVSGEAKADTLKTVMEENKLPASFIDPVKGQATWIIDAAAAAKL
jgi:6-phosphogluconolactonase